jgi:hypothetical protein
VCEGPLLLLLLREDWQPCLPACRCCLLLWLLQRQWRLLCWEGPLPADCLLALHACSTLPKLHGHCDAVILLRRHLLLLHRPCHGLLLLHRPWWHALLWLLWPCCATALLHRAANTRALLHRHVTTLLLLARCCCSVIALLLWLPLHLLLLGGHSRSFLLLRHFRCQGVIALLLWRCITLLLLQLL